MLFSVEPKNQKYDLFNREEDLKRLSWNIERDKMIILYGLRRIGKTSLIKTYLNTTEHYSLFVDCRKFITGNKVEKSRFQNELLNQLEKELKRNKLTGLLKKIASVTIKGVEINLNSQKGKHSLSDILQELDTVLVKRDKRLVIVFDEAQILRLYGRGGIDLLYLFAYVYDNLKNVVFILTGSEVGLLFDFLKLYDPKQPLYGRYVTEMVLKRFEENDSRNFIISGMKEIGHELSKNELDAVVSKLDGIVGYLSMFGYEYYRYNGDMDKALKKVEQLAQALVKKEIESLIKNSKNYAYCLNAIALNMNRFSTISRFIKANFGNIYDSTLSNILNSLQKHSIIDVHYEKRKKLYYFPDPLVQRYCAQLR